MRISLGVVVLYFFIVVLRAAPALVVAQKGWSVPGGNWWVAAILCLWSLSWMVNSGFGREWGRWAQAVYLLLLVGAVLWDRLEYGSFWAPPLGFLVLLLLLYVFGHAGLSFLVAGAAGTPG